GDSREKHAERDETKSQYDIETALISPPHCVEAALAQSEEAPMMRLFRSLEETRGHHRGQRQRYQGRYHDGHRQRHREFPEQPPDDAAHQQERYQSSNQGNANRYDG